MLPQWIFSHVHVILFWLWIHFYLHIFYIFLWFKIISRSILRNTKTLQLETTDKRILLRKKNFVQSPSSSYWKTVKKYIILCQHIKGDIIILAGNLTCLFFCLLYYWFWQKWGVFLAKFLLKLCSKLFASEASEEKLEKKNSVWGITKS